MNRITYNELKELYDKNSSPTLPPSDLEPDSGNAPLGAQKIKRFNSQCSINIHSKRFRLTDPDGVSAKAVIDGMVRAGLFADDSAKQITEVTFSQEKISKPEIEETIITINSAETSPEGRDGV